MSSLEALFAQKVDAIHAEMRTELARLEGRVETLTALLQPAGMQTLRFPSEAATIPPSPALLIPREVADAIQAMSGGNRALARHLTSVAMEMLYENLEPAVIAKKIREGEKAP